MEKIPPLVVREHDGVLVVRDDLFPYGSKARFGDKFFSTIKESEVVYGSSPRWGYAQISIAWLANRHGKRFRMYIANSREFHPNTKRAIALGADVETVNPGYLTVTQRRARNYAEQTGALLLGCGLDLPDVVGEIARIASSLAVKPDEVWTVASSGTLQRGLQLAWPSAQFFAVQVGRHVTSKEVGKAKIINHPLKFEQRTRNLPPFPSVGEYDAKAWEFIPKDGRKLRLFWNVGA